MTLPLILLIATRSFMSCANRLKYKPAFGVVPHTMIRPVMTPPMVHTPVIFSQPRMQVASPSVDDIPEFWYASGMVRNPRWNTNISGTLISHQRFPPTTIYCTDTMRLLQKWEGFFMDSFATKVRAAVSTDIASPTPPSKTAKYFEDAKAEALYSMRDIISQIILTHLPASDETPRFNDSRVASVMRRDYEMVGLVPKDFEMPSLKSGLSAVSLPVVALGVFARDKLDDDRRGSLRKKIEEQCGKRWGRSWWGRPKRQFDVFAIEGLSDAPGSDLSERSAKLLLTRMKQYANTERKVIVVPQWAYISRSGKDLTKYYEHLGFEVVEMEGQMHALVYTGNGIEDMPVENQPIMVDMNFWTDV